MPLRLGLALLLLLRSRSCLLHRRFLLCGGLLRCRWLLLWVRRCLLLLLLLRRRRGLRL